MIYIPLEALQANTQGVRPDDMTDGGQTSTILWIVSWISPSLHNCFIVFIRQDKR